MAEATVRMALADVDEIRRAVQLIVEPGRVVELRSPNTRRATISGCFDNPARLVEAAAELSGQAGVGGVYTTLNPVRPDLLARAANHVNDYAKNTTTDADIVARCRLAFDFDPVRPAGISSTNAEHQEAIRRAGACRDFLRARGWPEPVYADSGNDAHLIYGINLPNDHASRDLVRRALDAIALYFSDEQVKVDQATYNASRIWKVYGTLAQKGDSTPDRPHRLAKILEAPAQLEVVGPQLLQALAALVPAVVTPTMDSRRDRRFDLVQWIAQHKPPVVAEGMWQGGRKYILNPCPWNPNHQNRSAFIAQRGSGAIVAGCLHDSCSGQNWHTLRELFEPGFSRKAAERGEKLSAHYRNDVWAERKLLSFQTAAEISAETPDNVDWISKPWVAAGSFTNVSGKVKAAGKTTFVMRMVGAVLDGLPFMGEPTSKTPVVYLTEQPSPSFKEALKAAGLVDRQDLCVLPWNRSVGFTWPEVAAAALMECKRIGARFLVVDTLHQFAQLTGDSENNAGDALEAVRPIQSAMADGIAVLVVTHDRKSGGDVGDSGRGSSAFAGAADIVLSIRRPEGDHHPAQRRVEALSRFAETPPVLIIELTSDGYIAHGSAEDVAAQQVRAKLLEMLPPSEGDAITLDALVKAIGGGRGTVQRVLDGLSGVCRAGAGKRGDPYRYYRSAETILSAQPTSLSGQKETAQQSAPQTHRQPHSYNFDPTPKNGAGADDLENFLL